MRRFAKSCSAALPALALMLVLLSYPVASATGNTDFDVATVISDTAAFIQQAVPSPGIGQTGGEWAVIALARSGAQVPDEFFRRYNEAVLGRLAADGGVLSTVKYSEYSRVALAMSALGTDPRDIGGFDLLAPLMNYDMTVYQGLNGPVFALTALTGAGYRDTPVQEQYIEYILSKQLDNGGFAMSGSIPEPDTTAMALTALSGLDINGKKQGVEISVAIGRGVEILSKLQRGTGGFVSYSSANSESVSQVIIALCSIGIPLDDARFVKDGNSLLDNLMTYYNDSGGFEHERGGGTSLMATEQALCALAALWRSRTGQNALYDMSDASGLTGNEPAEGLPGRHPDIGSGSVLDPCGVLDDMGIAKASELTRAEFVAAAVRTLGLESPGGSPVFGDVQAGSRFYEDIQTAFAYGMIEGRGPGVFDPDGSITLQEAAVLISRASGLCGLGAGIVFDDTAIRNILSPFTDYRTCASWAAEGLAFSYYFGLFDDSSLEIMPYRHVIREEAADMLARMLTESWLDGRGRQ